MENANDFFQLPEEVLMEILSFLLNRFEVAQVCKKFYELICIIDKNRYKLKAGVFYGETLEIESILATQRKFDSMHAYLEFENEGDVETLKKIFTCHGQSIQKLEWSSWKQYQLKHNDFVSMLNLMPNLTELEVDSWRTEFLTENSTHLVLNLTKLKHFLISDCDGFLIETFSRLLPENILKMLKISRMQIPKKKKLRTFISKQKSIEHLEVEDDFGCDSEIFKELKLSHLRCVLSEGKSTTAQQNFLKELITSQPSIVELDLMCDRAFAFLFVNDEIFQEICNLKLLKSLKISIDGVSPNIIQNFSKLHNLKSLHMQTNHDTALESFKELSFIRNSPLENLTFSLWSFEIPTEVYEQFGMNFKLKSLTITLGTWHKVNFFKKSFPDLKALSIRFGEANNTVEFSKSYVDDGQIHVNMKHLELQFHGNELIDNEMFFKMLRSFPNLESLEICSSFPFTSEFFDHLISNLGNIKYLELSSIRVRNKETFPPEIVLSLKKLRRKLTFCKLTLSNIQHIFRKFGDEHDCTQPIDDEIDKVDYNFTFEPLMAPLKYDFAMKEWGYSNIRICNFFVMTAGKRSKKYAGFKTD